MPLRGPSRRVNADSDRVATRRRSGEPARGLGEARIVAARGALLRRASSESGEWGQSRSVGLAHALASTFSSTALALLTSKVVSLAKLAHSFLFPVQGPLSHLGLSLYDDVELRTPLALLDNFLTCLVRL